MTDETQYVTQEQFASVVEELRTQIDEKASASTPSKRSSNVNTTSKPRTNASKAASPSSKIRSKTSKGKQMLA